MAKNLELLLERIYYSEQCTIGSLSIESKHFCYTLEDVIRPIGEKIPGETAIPAGRYKVIVTMSNRFKRLMPLLENVEGFTGVRIHTGNEANDTDGCILVGKEMQPYYRIYNCAVVYNELLRRIKETIASGAEVWITIKDPVIR